MSTISCACGQYQSVEREHWISVDVMERALAHGCALCARMCGIKGVLLEHATDARLSPHASFEENAARMRIAAQFSKRYSDSLASVLKALRVVCGSNDTLFTAVKRFVGARDMCAKKTAIRTWNELLARGDTRGRVAIAMGALADDVGCDSVPEHIATVLLENEVVEWTRMTFAVRKSAYVSDTSELVFRHFQRVVSTIGRRVDNVLEEDGRTLLYHAVERDRTDVVFALLRASATSSHVQQVTNVGAYTLENALVMASIRGHARMVQDLLNEGAHAHALTPVWREAFCALVEKGEKGTIRALLERLVAEGVDITHPCAHRSLMGVARGRIAGDVMIFCATNGIDAGDIGDSFVHDVARYVSWSRDANMLLVELARVVANMNERNHRGNTILHEHDIRASIGAFRRMRLNPLLRNVDGKLPMHEHFVPSAHIIVFTHYYAATRIQAAFRGYMYRKYVFMNPFSEIGRCRIDRISRAWVGGGRA